MSRDATPGVGGMDVPPRLKVRNSGRLELLADEVDIGEMHDKADGFIRANEFIEGVSDNSGGMDPDKCLQAVEDGVALGVRLALRAKGRPIQVVTANDAYGACRFYFIGTVAEVARKFKGLVDPAE
jgi:hypothetical protein